MKVTFLGAAHEVTGSCSLIEAAGRFILVDCGMEQGEDTYENAQLPISPGEVDAVLLTHAHIDHSGMLPALAAGGYKGPIYATEATRRLCEIILRDSAHIQEQEAEWRNRKAKRSGGPEYQPVYTLQDAEAALQLFESRSYGEEFQLFPGVSASFSDAGHLLGSASILVRIEEPEGSRSLLFSGDLGNIDRPLIRDPAMPPAADYVVVESTYGDRLHGERPDYLRQLTLVIQRTLDRGGNLVIPAFAVGRTQELLYLIRTIKERGLISGHDGFPVYVDSPLAAAATNIYSDGMTEFYDRQTLELLRQGKDPIKFADLRLSVTSDESKAINFDPTPKVIISASGMCEAGRIRHHLKHNLWRPESTVLFVGYQAEGTIGRKLTEGESPVRLFGEDITVRAEITQLEGISGHADRDMLLGWLRALPKAPLGVFVNHGEDLVCQSFALLIKQQLGFEATPPFSSDCFDLLAGEWVAKGVITPARERTARRKADSVYRRLESAGQRLLAVIRQNRGLANKELARFADQINALCDKYSRK